MENNYMEQYETNTWKRLWRKIGDEFNFEKYLVIGADKMLFLYNKDNNVIYQAI